jgi:hypothetical protein
MYAFWDQFFKSRVAVFGGEKYTQPTLFQVFSGMILLSAVTDPHLGGAFFARDDWLSE